MRPVFAPHAGNGAGGAGGAQHVRGCEVVGVAHGGSGTGGAEGAARVDGCGRRGPWPGAAVDPQVHGAGAGDAGSVPRHQHLQPRHDLLRGPSTGRHRLCGRFRGSVLARVACGQAARRRLVEPVRPGEAGTWRVVFHCSRFAGARTRFHHRRACGGARPPWGRLRAFRHGGGSRGECDASAGKAFGGPGVLFRRVGLWPPPSARRCSLPWWRKGTSPRSAASSRCLRE